MYEDIYDAKNATDHLSGFNVCGRYLIVLYYQVCLSIYCTTGIEFHWVVVVVGTDFLLCWELLVVCGLGRIIHMDKTVQNQNCYI